MGEDSKMMVSVIMLTYKHELFIQQAVEAVLMQKVDFAFELIIANDNSPDKTHQIIEEIIANHPKGRIINYFNNESNVGAMPNSRKAFNIKQGKYFALCEGDDYWTDSLKLQKQVDFLESNPDFSICFHNTKIEFFEKGEKPYFQNEKIAKDVFTLDDLIGEDEIWFMATVSLVIRSAAFSTYPDWLDHSKSGDIPIIILSARYGPIKYLTDIMAVYRKHAGGLSLTDHKNEELFLMNRIYMYNMLNSATDYKFSGRLKRNTARYYFMLLDAKEYTGQYFKKWPIILKYIGLTAPDIPHFKILLRDHIFPMSVLNSYRRIKKILGLMPSN